MGVLCFHANTQLVKSLCNQWMFVLVLLEEAKTTFPVVARLIMI